MFNKFLSKSLAVYEFMWKNKNASLRYHCYNEYLKASQWHVIRTLSILRYRVDTPSMK
jgi:hypothetical protein